MATKVHCKSFLPGYYPMRDLNEDTSSSSWPRLNGEKNVANGQYIDGFMSRMEMDGYPGYGKDALKQKMLEHETVFRNQVYELHRVYRLQRDMMEEIRRKELHKRTSIEPSSSSSLLGFQMPSERHTTLFPLSYSGYERRSILGVEIVNSPPSCLNKNEAQPSQFLFKNGFTSKDCQILDSRPSKVRKKLFDLQLPAEEYDDSEEGENLPEYKVPDIISSYILGGNAETASEHSSKLITGSRSGVKVDDSPRVPTPKACLRASVRLADLNEPIQIEESMTPLPVEFNGHASTNVASKGNNQSANSNADVLGVTHDGFFVNSSVYSKINKTGLVSHVYEAGSSNNLGSMSHKLPMLSHPRQCMLNPFSYPPGVHPSVEGRKDLQRDGPFWAEFSHRNRDNSHNSHLEPPVASQSMNPFFSSPCSTNSRSHSISSWAKPKVCFTQQMITSESSLNPAALLNRRFLPSQNQEPFAGKQLVNVSSRLNPGFGSEDTPPKEIFHGFVSGSKELRGHSLSTGLCYLNSGMGDKVVSDRLANKGIGTFVKSSCREDPKPVLDFNLNEVVSSSTNEPLLPQDINTIHRKSKPENNPSALPWLRSKPIHCREGDSSHFHTSSIQFWSRDLNEPFMLASTDCETQVKEEISEIQHVQKVLGFPIANTIASKREASPLVSISSVVDCLSEKKNVKNKRKDIFIDINLACEPDEQISNEELTVEKPTKGTCYIDLNTCVSDCEDLTVPLSESKSNSVKVTLEIDLEAPVSLENEHDVRSSKENFPYTVAIQSLEYRAEPIQDKVLRIAADTIVSISSSIPEDYICHPSEASFADSLLWFVNAMSSCAVELEHKSSKESIARKGPPLEYLANDVDEFEAMTLQLAETNEEDYFLWPIVSEAVIEDDTASNMRATRARRGQSRRGRQRRDFQRDILPGLTSLSRHEVTEDIQTFGGLMRATGHHWNSGLTRRSGGRNRGPRGRRRAVVEATPTAIPNTVCAPLIQQLNKIESGLEDRSLAGWGKTLRRPRRQRCPAGNPPTVALT